MFRASMPPPARPFIRRFFFAIGLALASGVLVLAYRSPLVDALESLLLTQPVAPPSQPTLVDVRDVPDVFLEVPGINQPATLPADKAALDDNTPVVGVCAGGRARAYLVEAFAHGPASHIVNDVLGGIPISVTFCDITGCTRVFAGVVSGKPLELKGGGSKDARMLLMYKGHRYRQETTERLDPSGPTFPYRKHPAEVTVWGEWRQAHPETDVYMGTVEEATGIGESKPNLSSPPKHSGEGHPTG